MSTTSQALRDAIAQAIRERLGMQADLADADELADAVVALVEERITSERQRALDVAYPAGYKMALSDARQRIEQQQKLWLDRPDAQSAFVVALAVVRQLAEAGA